MTVTDDALLAALRDALVTGDAAEPSPEEMALFHEILAGASAGAPIGAGGRIRTGARRGTASRLRLGWDAWRALPPRVSPALFGAAAALGVLGLLGGAVAANTLPGPLRSVAYDAGLPVSSPALMAAEGAESALQGALRSKDRSTIASDVAVLRQRLSALDPSDRATADPKAQRLLSEAAVLLEHGTSTSTTGPSGSTSSSGSAGAGSGGSTGTATAGATGTPSTTGLVVPPPVESPEPSDSTEPVQSPEPSDSTEPVQSPEPSDGSTSSGTSSDASGTSSSSGSSDTSSSSTPSTSATPSTTSTTDGSSSTTDS
jgi:hypothetical protein